MANAASLCVTIDHHVIFSWAQWRGAHPSTFEGGQRPWPCSLISVSPAPGSKTCLGQVLRGIRVGRSRATGLALWYRRLPRNIGRNREPLADRPQAPRRHQAVGNLHCQNWQSACAWRRRAQRMVRPIQVHGTVTPVRAAAW